jgi:hypothetical protein
VKTIIRLAIWVVGLTAPVAVYATPVTWSFYETAITSCGFSSPSTACVLPPQPFVLLTLTLPGPTSAGTATWLGTGTVPVYTGDSFALTLPFARPLTPAFAGDASNPGGIPCSNGNRSTICDFNISWSETAGDLTSVSINVDAVNDNIGGFAGRGAFGLTGGPLASDGTLGGCSFTQCTVGGFWQSDLAIPEPMSVVLLIAGLLGTCLASRSRARRLNSEPASPAAGTRGIGFLWCGRGDLNSHVLSDNRF